LPLVESQFNVGLLPIAWQRRGQIEITMTGKIMSDGEADRPARMTPAEFKAAYKSKGWTGRLLAERWSYSVAWISKVGNDPERDQIWDDAIRGLPSVK